MSGRISKGAQNLLMQLAAAARRRMLGIEETLQSRGHRPDTAAARELIGAGLAKPGAKGGIAITPEGAAWVARLYAAKRAEHIDPFVAQHLSIETRDIDGPDGAQSVAIDGAESPLAWLARRKGRDGAPLIEEHQFAAGERLRAEFTRGHMMPRVTANWQAAVTQGARASRDGFAPEYTETVIAARQRVHAALDAAGPEFSGLLLDVCCFLKGLEEVERERHWPARSAKIVLQLALNRLARHYGLGAAAHGRSRREIRAWAEAQGTSGS